MKRTIVLPVAALLLTLTACTALSMRTPIPQTAFAARAIRIEKPIVPPDVPMLDQDGRPAKLSGFHGKHVLVFFGNIACQDDCLDGLTEFEQLRQLIGPRNDMAYVMVGTDIMADAPDKLKAHLAQSGGVMGLTAQRAPMRELAVKFGIHTYERSDGALAPHAPFTYLLDPDGRLIYFFQDGLPAQDIARVLTKLLAAKTSWRWQYWLLDVG